MTRAEFINRLEAIADQSFGCARTAQHPDGNGCWVQEALGGELSAFPNGEPRFYPADFVGAVHGVLRCELRALVRASDVGTPEKRRALVARMRQVPAHIHDFAERHPMSDALCEQLSGCGA